MHLIGIVLVLFGAYFLARGIMPNVEGTAVKPNVWFILLGGLLDIIGLAIYIMVI